MSTDSVECITPHCAGRMRDRTSGELVSAVVAYERGVTVEIPLTAPVPRHDEAVYDELTDTVVFRRDQALVTVYGLSPAHLTLDDAGRLGVKVVTGDDTVAFRPVDLADQGPEAAWVSGLPETVTVITVGQGFVEPGQTVTPVPEDRDR